MVEPGESHSDRLPTIVASHAWKHWVRIVLAWSFWFGGPLPLPLPFDNKKHVDPLPLLTYPLKRKNQQNTPVQSLGDPISRARQGARCVRRVPVLLPHGPRAGVPCHRAAGGRARRGARSAERGGGGAEKLRCWEFCRVRINYIYEAF